MKKEQRKDRSNNSGRKEGNRKEGRKESMKEGTSGRKKPADICELGRNEGYQGRRKGRKEG